MAIAIRMAQTTWEGPLASGTGVIRMGSGAAGELAVTWASRTGRADGKTSPEELAAKVRRGARNAAALRATIAALSLALLALGTVIAT